MVPDCVKRAPPRDVPTTGPASIAVSVYPDAKATLVISNYRRAGRRHRYDIINRRRVGRTRATASFLWRSPVFGPGVLSIGCADMRAGASLARTGEVPCGSIRNHHDNALIVAIVLAGSRS